MSTPALPHSQQRRLRDHFGFARLPFRKNVPAHQMFDSESQRALLHGLRLWLDLRGLALVTGSSGVGKSICLRRVDEESGGSLAGEPGVTQLSRVLARASADQVDLVLRIAIEVVRGPA